MWLLFSSPQIFPWSSCILHQSLLYSHWHYLLQLDLHLNHFPRKIFSWCYHLPYSLGMVLHSFGEYATQADLWDFHFVFSANFVLFEMISPLLSCCFQQYFIYYFLYWFLLFACLLSVTASFEPYPFLICFVLSQFPKYYLARFSLFA